MFIAPETAQPSQLIVLGRGIEMVEGAPVLGEGSVERANRAAAYYHGNPDVFQEGEARIVCSGGFPRLSEDSEGALGGASEGSMMADILMQQGVPRKRIEVEGHSRSTLQNFLLSEELLALYALTPQRPLGIVSHGNIWQVRDSGRGIGWGHLPRAVDMAHKAYGSDIPLTGVTVKGVEDGVRAAVQERVMRAVWRAVLADIEPRDKEGLISRENLVTRVATALRAPLRRIIK